MPAHKASPVQLSAEHERELNDLVGRTPRHRSWRNALGSCSWRQPAWASTRPHSDWEFGARRPVTGGAGGGMRRHPTRCGGAPERRSPLWCAGDVHAEVICQIIALACENPETLDVPISHWSQSELARQSVARGIVKSISHGSVGRFLKKRPISSRTVAVTG